jgi:antirestriction protein
MENINHGVSPDDDINTIMSDIEKYTQEEKDNANLEEPEGKDYIDPREQNIEEHDEQEATEEEPAEKAELAEEQEAINEADIFKDKYYAEKKKRKSLYADRQNLEDENKELKKILGGTMNTNAELYGRDLYKETSIIR